MKSEFKVGILEYVLLRLFIIIVSTITFGLATPWLLVSTYRWEAENTYINGKQLYFDGTAIQLFGKWILWLFLTIITFGLYGFILSLKLKQWVVSHTFIMEEYKK
ncbi:YjgN family protein [Streptobacillus canis]|uniref:hypothetical protein n=1 Tax=Streptobacillus canis TaxID=2678686 RepID=UPI0012E13DD4|nr:hypothetical protein [Streptobacillus canis]